MLERTSRLLRIALIVPLLGLLPGVSTGAEPNDFPHFVAHAQDIFQGKGDDFASYVALHDAYDRLTPAARKGAGQLLSMIDAMYGRYDDASRHYADTFPAKVPPLCPSGPYAQTPLDAAILTVAARSRVLLINESHSMVQTRAAIIELLPTLRKAGFTDLALEALNPANADSLINAPAGAGRSALPDDIKAGFYLREPVYARMVENAKSLGFGLVAYESEDVDHQRREAQQADHLQAWLNLHPKGRLLVIAGYSHIWKNEGWMAEKLMASTGGAVVSIDQIDGLGGCRGPKPAAVPSLWLSSAGQAWTLHPERVDATVTWRTSDRRGHASTWLSLGGMRKPVSVPSACHGKRPCLVEATRDDARGGVPEDRLVTFKASESSILYVTPGNYIVVERTLKDVRRRSLDVQRDGTPVWKLLP
ncbi:hypothetical protein [Dyella sp. 333MFSha]|uniref:hypothetical protein n=1 Tax=Dyella sp. 333MFSha TaxID=1798240 RepID=UPI00088C93BC|nr:hypothetical protein [Dyella sp. 333MFSha]SDG54165.1 hypothetical protein SAMN04515659_3040 [Dyella sp. 333MFSha]